MSVNGKYGSISIMVRKNRNVFSDFVGVFLLFLFLLKRVSTQEVGKEGKHFLSWFG